MDAPVVFVSTVIQERRLQLHPEQSETTFRTVCDQRVTSQTIEIRIQVGPPSETSPREIATQAHEQYRDARSRQE